MTKGRWFLLVALWIISTLSGVAAIWSATDSGLWKGAVAGIPWTVCGSVSILSVALSVVCVPVGRKERFQATYMIFLALAITLFMCGLWNQMPQGLALIVMVAVWLTPVLYIREVTASVNTSLDVPLAQ